MHKHHLVPSITGGQKGPTIWLCGQCHGFVHGRLISYNHSELTKRGIEAARTRGRMGGNPGLRARDPEVIRRLQAARDAVWLQSVVERAGERLPTVKRLRPGCPWADVARALNGNGGMKWTAEKLRRTVKRLVAEGRADAFLLERAVPKRPGDHLQRMVAAIAATGPDLSFQQIAARLEAMHEPTPRGGTRWHASSVRNLLLAAGGRAAAVARH